MKKYTNEQMNAMLNALVPFLDRRDVIGYAAARNTRILQEELSEYTPIRNELLLKYGEKEISKDGQPTGGVLLRLDSPHFGEFAKEIDEFAKLEHEPKLFKVKFEQAIGVLSGSELLEIEWMFEE